MAHVGSVTRVDTVLAAIPRRLATVSAQHLRAGWMGNFVKH
jgi:hypothetical protein